MKLGFYDYLVGREKTKTNNDFVTVNPRSLDEAGEIVAGLRRGEAYVVDLEKTDTATAQRILDVLSGAVYALTGRYKVLKGRMYLFLPKTITVIKRKKNGET